VWEFFSQVLKTDGGGWGLLIALWLICNVIEQIVVALIKRVKTPKKDN